MKEVKKAQKEQDRLLEKIETKIAFYEDALRFEMGGDTVGNKTIKFDRASLYREIWEISLTKVAKKYDVPYQKLKDACVKANIPLPTPSYWGSVRVGKAMQKEELPDSELQEVEVEFTYRVNADSLAGLLKNDSQLTEQVTKDELTQEVTEKKTDKQNRTAEMLNFLSEEERVRVTRAAAELSVPAEVKKLHPVLQKHKGSYIAWGKKHPRDKYANWNRDIYRRRPEGEPPLWESVSEETLPRVYRFLDPLFHAIEALGGRVNHDLSMQIRGELVFIEITEAKEKTPHVLTKSEQKELERYEKEKPRYSYASEPKFRKYDYIPTGKLRIAARENGFVRDSTTAGIEERIGEILLLLYIQSEEARIAREKREEAKRKAEEEARQKELRKQRYNEEVDRLQFLNNEANDFDMACKIRAYVAAIEAKPDLDASTLAWIEWAKAKADWYDPAVSAADPLFGKRNHGAEPRVKDPVKKGLYW